jgi:hypothetical protein
MQEAQQRGSEIGAVVLQAIGQPDSLQQVQVRHLWGVCYRVNVFVGADFNSAVVAHSYFVVTDGEGAILESTPPLTRRYLLPPAKGASHV